MSGGKTKQGDRYICSECFSQIFPDANPFNGTPLWSPTTLNFNQDYWCWWCKQSKLTLDSLEDCEIE